MTLAGGATARPPSPDQSGFTLVELMISMGLFALIAVAGVALVDGVLGVQSRTEGRLDRLAELQRSMFVLTSDLDQVARGPIAGGGPALSFVRAAPGLGGAPVPVRYELVDGMLVRVTGDAPQLLATGVSGVRWRFWDGAWVDRWPPAQSETPPWPRAVEVELQLRAPGGSMGTLRRVVALPRQAEALKPVPVEEEEQ